MATWMTVNDLTYNYSNNGTALKAAGSVAADGATTAVTLGKGKFLVKIVLASFTTGTGYDTAALFIQANTKAASTTFKNIGLWVVGDAAALGESTATAGTYQFIVDNPYDYQVKIYNYLNGSTTAVSYSATVYPLAAKE